MSKINNINYHYSFFCFVCIANVSVINQPTIVIPNNKLLIYTRSVFLWLFSIAIIEGKK